MFLSFWNYFFFILFFDNFLDIVFILNIVFWHFFLFLSTRFFLLFFDVFPLSSWHCFFPLWHYFVLYIIFGNFSWHSFFLFWHCFSVFLDIGVSFFWHCFPFFIDDVFFLPFFLTKLRSRLLLSNLVVLVCLYRRGRCKYPIVPSWPLLVWAPSKCSGCDEWEGAYNLCGLCLHECILSLTLSNRFLEIIMWMFELPWYKRALSEVHNRKICRDSVIFRWWNFCILFDS